MFTKTKQLYKKLSMKNKLMISFSVPLCVISILIALLIAPILSNKYHQQVQYSVSQSGLQAKEFAWNYINSMYYVSRLIEESNDIQSALGDERLGTYRNDAEAYREFYKLRNVFNNIEMANASYRIGIYVPDQVDYSNNNYYFYPYSSLEQMEDYDEIIENVEKGYPYFTLLEEKRSTDPSKTDTYLTLFGKVVVERRARTYTYITKVQMPLLEMQRVLENAKATQNSILYLIDGREQIISFSDSLEAGLEEQLPKQLLKPWSVISLEGKKYYVVNYELERFHWMLFSLIPVTDYQNSTDFVTVTMILMTLILVGAIVIVAEHLSEYYVKRLAKINVEMKSIETGNMNTKIALPSNPEGSGDEIDEIYANFNYMAEKLQQIMKDHYKLGKNVMSAELKALQAQINPHFLYNTLDLINWGAIEYGAEDVAAMARSLGQFYKLSLNHGKSAIMIGEELKHVEAYVNIEKRHFPGAVELEIDVPEEVKQYACLNIILQPFVENAIVHGIAEHPDIIDCLISIRAVKEENDIIFYIHDDGYGMTKEIMDEILVERNGAEGNGYGVKNINFRIKLCYGDKYGVAYDDSLEEGDGTTVIIRIPAMTYEELETVLA